jgi:hypothetical protein
MLQRDKRRWDLKIRRDALAVSSILFTFALLVLAPPMLWDALTVSQTSFQVTGTQTRMQNCFAPAGFASLAVIAIGLIVTWAGYIKGVRWTWFVMFVIVWLWAFPVLLLPYVQHLRNAVPITEWLPVALRESGPQRDFVEVVLTFLLMVVALVLPVKTFILGQARGPGR